MKECSYIYICVCGIMKCGSDSRTSNRSMKGTIPLALGDGINTSKATRHNKGYRLEELWEYFKEYDISKESFQVGSSNETGTRFS
jgi:hypothetical protein